jgi:hypothetical protein
MPGLELYEYMLDKETPKGYWIRPLRGGYLGFWKKWIPKVSRKRYAYPTEKEALESCIARKQHRVRYLKRDLHNAEVVLKQAMKELEKY